MLCQIILTIRNCLFERTEGDVGGRGEEGGEGGFLEYQKE